jgi:hypothetical protein
MKTHTVLVFSHNRRHSSHLTLAKTQHNSRYFNACTMPRAAAASSIRSMPAMGSV